MSLAKMGNKPSLETIEKLRASHLGKPLSKSTKAKLSAALMGKNKGHIHTEETKPDIHPIDKSRGF